MIGWIVRNEQGLVTAFSAVAYTDPIILDDFRESGTPELVEAARISLNRPLPEGSRILMSLNEE